MQINVGSRNPNKVAAVAEIVKNYPLFESVQVQGVAVSSGVAEQPLGLEETIRGARARALAAYQLGADYGFGLESGLIPVPYAKTGYMDVTACVIYDGQEYHQGLSGSFEYPKETTRLVLKEKMDISSAFRKQGLTDKARVGAEEGAIGVLTKGRLPRQAYSQQAITMALIHLENEELY